VALQFTNTDYFSLVLTPLTPGDKKLEPSETKLSIKKTFKGIKPFYATYINTNTSYG
jgi:hypothetical protein